MQRRQQYDPAGRIAGEIELLTFDPTDLNPVGILFQTGYLTVAEYLAEDYAYRLDYPNLEVRFSLEQLLFKRYTPEDYLGSLERLLRVRNALRDGDIKALVENLNAAYAGVPYEFWRRDDEHIFHAVFHLIFHMLSVYVQSEVHTARGRCDALVMTDKYIYAFELKRDRSAAVALQQIDERGYLDRFADDPRTKRAVGINFDSSERKIDDWAVA